SSDTTADDRLRLAQADFVRASVEELKAAEADVPVVVLGDFNDVEDSPPLQRLEASGRLLNPPVRPAGERPYTYVFQGFCQTLDHVLIDPALAPWSLSICWFSVLSAASASKRLESVLS